MNSEAPRSPVGYVRKSSADAPVDRQIETLEAAGIKRIDIFVDHVEGRALEQPKLHEAMQAAKSRGVGITTCRISALGGSAKGVMRSLYTLRQNEIPLVAIEEPMQVDGPGAAPVLDMLLSLFEMEHKLEQERLSSELNSLAGPRADRPVGRPTKMTPKRQELGIAALKQGRRGDEVWEMLAKIEGPQLGRSTYYGWQKKMVSELGL